MFSRPVPYVGGTRILAVDLPDGEQGLAYAMSVDLDGDTAMVLPIPVPPQPAEDAVAFVDLSGEARLFEELAALFPAVYQPESRSRGFQQSRASTLEVHRVGAFDASFVPTLADMDRLDPRFRMADDVWRSLPRYGDHGFVVFVLAAEPWWRRLFRRKRQHVHPMAFRFPRRDPAHLFFPTVHVHDGSVPDEATFDHELYAVGTAPDGDWEQGEPVPARLRAGGLLREGVRPCRRILTGRHPNTDTVLSI